MEDKLKQIDSIINKYTEIYSQYSLISTRILEIKEIMVDLENQRLDLKCQLDATRKKEQILMDYLQKNNPEEFNKIKFSIADKIKKMM